MSLTVHNKTSLIYYTTNTWGALRGEGFGDLVYETVNANSLSAFVKEQIEENGDVLPEWLDSLVDVFEKTSVSLRKAAK